MIECFGEEEMICLTDKNQPRTKAIDLVRYNCMADKACAYINYQLACCGFDIKQINQHIASGNEFPFLCHAQTVLTRYYLYDTIKLSNGRDHEARRRFEDLEKDFKECCESGVLVDQSGCIICKKESSFAIAGMESCLPEKLCSCKKSDCCCGSGY